MSRMMSELSFSSVTLIALERLVTNRTPRCRISTRRRRSRLASADRGSCYCEQPGWRICSMAKLVFGMNQSLDGYVDHQEFAPPGPALFRHFTAQVRDL